MSDHIPMLDEVPMPDGVPVPDDPSDTEPALNRAARRARGKGDRQPLPPHLAGKGSRSSPVPRKTDFAARRSG